MSYIDAFNHSHIGLFYGIPVYHPFNNSENSELHSDMIVIGGGSGEHNMFVLEGINQIVVETLDHFFGSMVVNEALLKKYNLWEDSVEWENQWSMQESHSIYCDICNDPLSIFESYQSKSAEKIVLLAIGLFLIDISAIWVDKELLDLEIDKSILPKTIIKSVSNDEVSGRYFLDSKVLNGISYLDELKILNFNSIN